ncbi:MAG TPA: maleylacetoacetate isomerase [Alphaproteobacteria bacterium]|nr:maleylacetoacetate isomerase [Alphaproteobacteria bacterium]
MVTIPTLHTYFRSSAAWRVRIALALKGLAYESRPVHLLKDGGQQFMPVYRALNPQAMVPTFEDEAGPLTQSLAIIDYIDETYPEPPLLPAEPHARARVRAIALAIACDIHPLNNLRVLKALRRQFGADDEAIKDWYRHWVAEGLAAVEALVQRGPGGPFCWGETPSLADICLVPQMANARRYDCDLEAFARLRAIDARCATLPAFAAASPDRQPDTQ